MLKDNKRRVKRKNIRKKLIKILAMYTGLMEQKKATIFAILGILTIIYNNNFSRCTRMNGWAMVLILDGNSEHDTRE